MLATSIKVSWSEAPSCDPAIPDAATVVGAILATYDEAQLDYTDAKLAFDKLIDDSIDADATLAIVEQMAATARHIAGPAAGPNTRLVALRQLLYEAGSWNDHRPFE